MNRHFGATDIYTQATQDAWAAGPWTYPNSVSTRPQAVVAMRWAFLEAKKELPAKAATFDLMAARAAYNYNRGSYTAPQILKIAADQLAAAPYTASKVRGIKVATVSVPTAPKKKSSSGGGSSSYYAPPEDQAAAAALPWYQQLPTWAPTAAGAAGVLLLAVTLWPRRAS